MSETEFKERMTGRCQTVSDIVFFRWKTGISRYEWRSEDGKLCVWSSHFRSTYSASVNGTLIGKRYRSSVNAMKAAAKASTSASSTVRGGAQ